MKRLIIVVVLALMSLFSPDRSYAIPAYPYPVSVTQPDGSVLQVLIRGDEFFHYTTTLSGDVVAQKSDGFYYYARYGGAGIEISSIKAGGASPFGGNKIGEEIIRLYRSRSEKVSYVENLVTKSGSKAAVQAKRGLIILVQYNDVKMKTSSPKAAFQNMSNLKGYSYNGATGSARDYFIDNSLGKYEPEFDVYGPYTLPNSMAYYGANNSSGDDVRPREMIADACTAANVDVDFNKYDADGDGEIDMVYVYYAGYSEAEGGPNEAIWPHKWSAINLMKVYDGKRLGVYACSNELRGTSGTILTGIGTFCHEFSHVLGMPDTYDTDGATNGKAASPGRFDLMSSGSYNNNGNTPPYYNLMERELAGWVTAPYLVKGNTILYPIQKNGGYKLESTENGEYFLIEYRNGEGWDRHLLSGGGGKGMVLYRVDRSSNRLASGMTINELWDKNKVNAVASHPCFLVIPSSGSMGEVNGARFLFPGSSNITKITANSPTYARDWNDQPLPYEIVNIVAGQDAMTFTTKGSGVYYSFSGKVFNKSGIAIRDASVKFSKVDATKSSGMLLKSIDKAEYSTDYVVLTNVYGEFSLTDLEPGDYDISISATGYSPFVTKYTLAKNVNNQIFELEKSDLGLQSRVTHAHPATAFYLAPTKPYAISQKFTAAHLETMKATGKTINAVYFYSSVTVDNVQISIKVNGVQQRSWSVAASAGYNSKTLDLPLVIEPNKSVELFVEFIGANPHILLDKGPAVTGFGDLIKIGNDAWTTLKRLSYDNNIYLGFWVDKDRGELDEPNVEVVKVGQREIVVEFFTGDANIEQWVITVEVDGKKQTKSFPPNSAKISYNQLEPNTLYSMTFTAEFGDKKKSKTENITTEKLTAPFAAIVLSEVQKGVKATPSLTNLPELPRSIVWRVDSKEIEESFTVESVGQHRIDVEITWNNGTKEIITKNFNVVK